MVHPLLWPASTTISPSSSSKTHAIPSSCRHKFRGKTHRACCRRRRRLAFVDSGSAACRGLYGQAKQSQTQSGYPGRLIISPSQFPRSPFGPGTSLQLNSTSSAVTGYTHKKKMAALPQPPSFDEHLASLESLPLFMSSLPDDPTDNVALSALQSLAHEGTPDGRCVHLCVSLRPR